MHGASWGWTFCCICSVFACMCASHITCGNTSSRLRPCSTVDTAVTITTTAHFLVCRCFLISQQKDLFHISTNHVVKHLLYLYNRTCTYLYNVLTYHSIYVSTQLHTCVVHTHMHTRLCTSSVDFVACTCVYTCMQIHQ